MKFKEKTQSKEEKSNKKEMVKKLNEWKEIELEKMLSDPNWSMEDIE